MAGLPTGTVTFLFTDIEGSTKLAREHPDAMLTLLARHHEILNESFRMHGGYAFQSEGDSFAVAFHSASDALNAALAAQRSLHNEAWSPVPINVRMGLHTGTAQLNPASAPIVYSGYTAIALAQRIMSAGHGGQILVSGATENLLRGQLPKDVSLRDMGRHHFKDVPQAVRVFQVLAPDVRQEFPPLRALDVLPNNLPAQLTSFVGREKEIAEVKQEVDEHRLVTLTGSGGIGKTRLSLEVAHEMLASFPNGVWFIELATLSDPALVPQALVTALGLIEQAGRSPVMVLTDFLEEKRALLILDNCEHLIQACASLAETLLHACPSLHILSTSQEALGIPGETVYPVRSLTIPDSMHMTPETFTDYEAVQLFVERARAALPNFSIRPENAPAIAQICQYLDGIPLALELAAARVKGLSVEQIASRLNDRFRLLTGGSRTALPRHQTLQALIDWSYNLLSEPERLLLRRLSIFAGGSTLEAAESACAGKGLESDQILDLLLRLVDKSLVVAETQEAEPRYHMLETIRQYGREKLWSAGEGEMMREQHLAYFADLAERAEPNLRAFDMVMWLDRLEAELDNIRAALEWAQESNVEAQLRLASALLWFWHIRGHKNEGADWLERGLSIEEAERGDQPLEVSRAMIRGEALNASGFLMEMVLEAGKATVRLEESLALFQKLGPAGKQGMAYALLRLGELPPLGALSPVDNQTRSRLEQSLTLFHEAGDKFGIAECLMLLAGDAYAAEDYEQAAKLGEEQLALRREMGDRDGIAGALGNLGALSFYAQNDYRRAITLVEESLAIFREVGNMWYLGYRLSVYGDICLWQGDYGRAIEIYEEAQALAQDLGEKLLSALTVQGLGAIAWFRGDYSRATQLITDSLTAFREVGHDWFTASSLHALGDIALAEGSEERAVGWYEAELAFGQETGLNISIAFAVCALGKVAWAQGNYELATKRLDEGLTMGREEGLNSATFHALYALGRVSQSQGDYFKARAYYAEVLEIQRQRFTPLFKWTYLKTYAAPVAYPLDALAVLAVTQKRMEAAPLSFEDLRRAARLFGAAETFHVPLRFEMSAKERAEHDQAVAAVRAALGDQTFGAAWEEGQKMTLDEARDLALKMVKEME